MDNKIGDHCKLVDDLFLLPHKILQHYNLRGLSQIILHELGHENNFDFNRAVYLIDNPDFDHLMGAAGYCNCDCKHHQKNLWKKPETFECDMKDAHYHNDVKKFLRQSLKRKDINLNSSDEVKKLGAALGIEKPKFFSWKMKHGNHGLLIFEPAKEFSAWHKKLLANSVALLSLCGI